MTCSPLSEPIDPNIWYEFPPFLAALRTLYGIMFTLNYLILTTFQISRSDPHMTEERIRETNRFDTTSIIVVVLCLRGKLTQITL